MKPHVVLCEDGSILVEWIGQDARFGISFEKDPKESSWFFVSKHGGDASGYLPEGIYFKSEAK